jgi:hypothetical protein
MVGESMKASIKGFLSNKGIRRMLWAALILSFLLAAWDGLTSYSRDMAIYLRISIKAPQSGIGTVYYDIGKQYNFEHVSSAFIPADGLFHEIRFRLPMLNTIYHLRFDPPSVKEGQIAINRVELTDNYGRLLKRYDLNLLQPLNQIKEFAFHNGEVRFSVDAPANDPYLDLGINQPISVDRFQFMRTLLSGIILEGIGIFSVGLFLIVIWSRFTDKTTAMLVILALFAAGWFLHKEILESRQGAVTSYFKVSMMSTTNSIAKLYYDLGSNINEEDLFKAEVFAGSDIGAKDDFRDYRFKIPGCFIQLRFDPLEGQGTVTIRKIEITDQYGKILHNVPFDALKPNVQIKTMEKKGQELVVVMKENADDPQIEILHAENYSPKPLETFPLWIFLRGLLMEWAAVGLCLLAAIVIRRRYAKIINCFIDGTFFQKKLHLFYLGFALALVLAMTVVSYDGGNPDEQAHEQCAAFYADRWLPAAVDDEAVLQTISGFGVSYLFRLEIVYFLAGKTAVLLSGLIKESYLGLRLFNVLLFGLLVMMAIRRTQSPLLFVIALVATPQVWYVFSYFNGDAFPLFLALFIAAQVMYTDSLSSQFFDSPRLLGRLSGGLLLGALIGLTLLSKMNYYVYLAFIGLLVSWRLFFETFPGSTFSWPLQMKKGILIVGIALCVYLPPTIYDQYVNDFQKVEKIGKVVEEKALYQFKPSTIKDEPTKSSTRMGLREKGVPFRAIFLEQDEWRKWSFQSFFGVYSYFLYYSKSSYYIAVSVLLAGAILFVTFYMAYHSVPWKDTIVLLMVLLFSLLAVGQSMYLSWTSDYQPQGRYLFPIIPIVLVGLTRLPEVIRQRLIPCLGLCFFLLSLSSFVFSALPFVPKVPIPG